MREPEQRHGSAGIPAQARPSPNTHIFSIQRLTLRQASFCRVRGVASADLQVSDIGLQRATLIPPLTAAQRSAPHHVQRLRIVRCAVCCRTGEAFPCCFVATLTCLIYAASHVECCDADLPCVRFGRAGSGSHWSEFQRLNVGCKFY